MPIPEKLNTILRRAFELKASDVHLHSGARLRVRVHGELEERGEQPVPAKVAESLLLALFNPEQREIFDAAGEIDMSVQVDGGGRVRANIYRQQRGIDAVFRLIPDAAPSLSDLMLPPELRRLTEWANGLVLVTGPAGSGKTSTIAALIDIINREERDHIITVEDPVEYLHPSKGCIVNQRQVGLHTREFASALRAALREDPDVIMVGELRDLESISLAVTAAETGHLVFATLHTRTTVESINRIINSFPIAQLSDSLRAVVTQRLVLSADKTRRLPALELLIVNPAVRGLILDNKTHLIISTQELGKDGMYTLDQSLTRMVRQRLITAEEARRNCIDPAALSR
jgi:twitching motility protein PilT